MVNGLRLSLQLYLRPSFALIMAWLDSFCGRGIFRVKHSLCYNGQDESAVGDKSMQCNMYVSRTSSCTEGCSQSHRII